MLTKEELLKLAKIQIPNSKPRPEYLEKIVPWLENKEIILLRGIRRCGKTHIMYQLMEQLPSDNTFYFNFEDFHFPDKKLLFRRFPVRGRFC